MPRKTAAALSIISVTGEPTRLKPPSFLWALERTVFNQIVASCDARHFRNSDLPVLARYCELIVLAEEAAQQLRGDRGSGLALGSTMPQLKLKVCGRRYDSRSSRRPKQKRIGAVIGAG